MVEVYKNFLNLPVSKAHEYIFTSAIRRNFPILPFFSGSMKRDTLTDNSACCYPLLPAQIQHKETNRLKATDGLQKFLTEEKIQSHLKKCSL